MFGFSKVDPHCEHVSTEQVEEESEQMTDTFLSGGDNLDEFLEQYHEKRKLAHLRRVKVKYNYLLV